MSASPAKTPSPQWSQSLPGTSWLSSKQTRSSTKSQASPSYPPTPISKMADNDTTITNLQAQITTLLVEKAARDAEDEEDIKEEDENPHKVLLAENLELAKKVKRSNML
ncbi:hypothetical protein RHMOL_Rhmol11G0022200 [Rhododendron molle]|uniref:Uncharacterized protein n=1 Tax=Rhododendron molle TaxID=49168 RepID=A0ACC0LNT1_RHOML|nr:hypothetical protein RHMOL_Rhmol11G0022200 [Rhododendron molle]